MKVHIFDIIPCLMAVVAHLPLRESTGNKGSHPATITIYDQNLEEFTLIDRTTLIEYDIDYYRYAIHLCPAKDSHGKVSHDVLSIVKTSSIVCQEYCSDVFQPSMVGTGANFNVGFYLLDEMDKPYNLQSFPSYSSSFEKNGKFTTYRKRIYDVETERSNFHTTQTRHRLVSYRRFLYNVPTSCEKFTDIVIDGVGSQFIPDVKQHYSQKNQKKLLHKYEHGDKYLFVATQLTPIDDFTDAASRLATCTYYNTTPLWSTVAEIVSQIERGIRRVADALDVGALEVITRTSGHLQLPLEGKNKPEQKVYLDLTNNKILVPEFLHKVLHYRAALPVQKAGDSGSTSTIEYQDYYMIIGVGNAHPYDRVKLPPNCDYKICLKYGWNMAGYYRQQLQTFCCDITDSNLAEDFKLDEFARGKPFDLNNVPITITEDGVQVRRFVQILASRYKHHSGNYDYSLVKQKSELDSSA